MIALQWYLIMVAEAVAAQVQLRPERPTELWPVSISGWVTLISSLIALGTVLVRANNKPVLDRLAGMEKKFDAEVQRIEGKADKIEKDLDRDKSVFLRQIERQKVDFLERVDEKINGFGRRLDDNRETFERRIAENRKDIDHIEDAIGRQALEMMEYKSGQKAMDVRVTEINTKADTLIRQLPDLEIRMNSLINSQTKEILRETGNLISAAISKVSRT